ncbi:hypothetical protein AIP98_21200 [Salmonella enterica]|nr:hypothetical protein [Salmonella enterica]EDW9721274.1 hypothetical protein [Salmonella enterica]EEL3640519.1 hypothetical protein [Salmonella enterica]
MSLEDKSYLRPENLIPGQGRPKGVPNKKTVARQEALKEYLLKGDKLFKLLDLLFYRIDNESEKVKTADIINALKWIAPYEVQTIAEQQAAARIDQILATDNPEQMKAEILDFVGKLKAV